MATKTSQVTHAQQLLAGVQKYLATVATLTLASTAYTPAQITAALQQLVTLFSDVAAAQSALKAKLLARNDQAPALVSLMADLDDYVRVTFKKSPDVLAAFGVSLKKAPTPLTTEEKMVAVAKRASTRKVRGTTGKKAKLAVKGDVTDVVVTPVTANTPEPPAAPAAPTAPATSGNGTGGTTPTGH